MLTLNRFRVTMFRSVQDSGWIETDKVTALIGTNESGKTNLLVPLWKLNPAKGGEIDLIADLPRAEYNRMRNEHEDQVFIEAEFATDTELQAALASATGVQPGLFDVVCVARRFNGEHVVSFPNAAPPRTIPKARLADVLSGATNEAANDPPKKQEAFRAAAAKAIVAAQALLETADEDIDGSAIAAVEAVLSKVDVASLGEQSAVFRRWSALVATVTELRGEVSKAPHEDNPKVAEAVISAIPSFVYYSNYGNLDSEIYLPHVIENLKRKGVGTKEEAKARTLKVLFEYVKLQPEEILELGARAAGDPTGKPPTQEAINVAAQRTKERSILLRSADTELTKSFRNWWKQGDYRFRFAADGDHFRIWVSDDKRPEEIELEARSTGLQWFFSFFLVFLVERRDAHKGAVLLLDEPGLSLHPLSQQDLSLFFQNLSETNPILFTTHSPFMVDADHLDRVRLVYVSESGATTVTSDLRATSPGGAETRSVYAVHAALGLSVSAALLQGCASVIVEGGADQFYLSAIKTVLIARKKIAPKRELLFVPAGGAKGVNSMAPIVTAKDEQVPVVVLDDDEQGRKFAESLKKGALYMGIADRILNVRDFAGGLEYAEVEDLLPRSIVADAVSRVARGKDDDFKDAMMPGPIVPQIEAYAHKNGVELALGWKVDLAREVKRRMLKSIDSIDEITLEGWAKLFAHFEPD